MGLYELCSAGREHTAKFGNETGRIRSKSPRGNCPPEEGGSSARRLDLRPNRNLDHSGDEETRRAIAGERFNAVRHQED